jgi:integrase
MVGSGIHKRPSSPDPDRSILSGRLLPILGNRPLESITPWELQKMVNSWAVTGSPASVSRQYATVRAIFNHAVTTDMLRRSPCRGVNLPPVEPRESPLVTAQDLEYMALHLPGYEPFPYLGGVLGLRWAEAVGLRVRSVDFTKNTVAVEQQWTRGAGGVMVSQRPKTRAGRRTIASPGWLIDRLANHLAERGVPQHDREGPIFLGYVGQRSTTPTGAVGSGSRLPRPPGSAACASTT